MGASALQRWLSRVFAMPGTRPAEPGGEKIVALVPAREELRSAKAQRGIRDAGLGRRFAWRIRLLYMAHASRILGTWESKAGKMRVPPGAAPRRHEVWLNPPPHFSRSHIPSDGLGGERPRTACPHPATARRTFPRNKMIRLLGRDPAVGCFRGLHLLAPSPSPKKKNQTKGRSSKKKRRAASEISRTAREIGEVREQGAGPLYTGVHFRSRRPDRQHVTLACREAARIRERLPAGPPACTRSSAQSQHRSRARSSASNRRARRAAGHQKVLTPRRALCLAIESPEYGEGARPTAHRRVPERSLSLKRSPRNRCRR